MGIVTAKKDSEELSCCAAVASLILDLGADVDAEDCIGFTPLCVAADYGNVDMINVLVKYGANVNHEVKPSGLSPLFLAARKLNRRAALALRDYGAIVNMLDIKLAALACGSKVLTLLKEAGTDFRRKEPDKTTVLHYAAFRGNVVALQWFIEQKLMDVNVTCDLARTPLHEAASEGHIDAVMLLISSGADPLAKDSLQDTPLGLAKIRHSMAAIIHKPRYEKVCMALKMAEVQAQRSS